MAYATYKNRLSEMLRVLISLLLLTKNGNTYKTRMKTYTEIGSPWRVPLLAKTTE